MDRNTRIIKISVLGIVVNLFLVLVKLIIGLLANSLAIILDAINNLSDALSSVITIIGTKLSVKAPDKKHPYGYGRIEYISSIIIAVIVLLAGFTSFKESAKKVIQPQAADYTYITLIVILIAVVVKFVLGRYVKRAGKEINSDSLIASGTEAVFDAVISFSTLIAAIVSMTWHISIEGILGAIISCVIIKAGLEILIETLNSIIGSRVDRTLSLEIKSKVQSYQKVLGAYDLVLHNYGPDEIIGSINIEVDDYMTAKEIHVLTRRISKDIYINYGIILTVGIYASNTDDNQYVIIKQTIQDKIKEYSEIIQMHGFYVDSESKLITFDLIIDFKAENPMLIKNAILKELSDKHPDYQFDIILDNDYSD